MPASAATPTPRHALGPLLIGLAGKRLRRREADAIRHPAVGGVVLFTRNYRDREQVGELVAAIRAESGRPLLVAVDHEGGRVQRFRPGFTPLPPLRTIGRLWAEGADHALDMAYRHGRVMATELLLLGIDLSFAPVLDLDGPSEVIGDRALARDPGIVARLARAYVAGMHDAGMKATGKHFPGHGLVVPDSHVADVTDPRPLADIAAADLVPFRELADTLDAVMMAHVCYPAVDDVPAGFSSRWIGEVLRGDCGFDGTVFSDDLGMHAAAVAGDMAARLHASLAAGCDAALVCDPGDALVLLDRLEGAPRDATAVLGRLRGGDPGRRADIERVPEWRQWRDSLAALSGASTDERESAWS